jgi:hypothetical protein
VPRLLAGLIVLIVAATPAADVYCRAVCLTPAAEAARADGGGHCALRQPSQAGPAMAGGETPCANPHAEVRVLRAAIKIERAPVAPAALAPAMASPPIVTIGSPAAMRLSLDRSGRSPLFRQSLPLRC